jgi:hypothetical protein
MIKQTVRNIAESVPLLRYLYYHLGKSYWALRYRLAGWTQPTPILIHQMGKVGSSSIYETLKLANLHRPVYHFHFMSPENLAMIRDSHQRCIKAGILEIDHTQILAPYLKRRILQTQDARWHVITLVRDPVARNVSGMFQNAHRWIPDFERRCHKGTITSDEVIQVFFERENYHRQVLTWLEKEIKPIYDIDVYATPFPHERGYHVYKSKRARLLLIRLEDLDRATETIAEFVGIQDFDLQESNIAADKYYGELYQEFRRMLYLPSSYLDEMYKSRFARHFYSDAEIETFRQKWSR